MEEHTIVPRHVIREEMLTAIQDFRTSGKGTINIRQGMRHHDLTEILHEFAYRSGKASSVTIMYTGQAAKPIQLCCLRSRSSQDDNSLRPLRASLISMRHLRIDHVVDIAWILNKELAQHGTHVAQDDYCYYHTLHQLGLLAYKGVRHIHLYQTGYQMAIIGFYRALIEYLQEPSSSLQVTPYYFDNDRLLYKKGTPWS